MSDIAEHYSKEIERLNRELAEVRKEAQNLRADRNGKVKTAEQQVQEARAEIEKLKTENGKLAKKIETIPGEIGAENERLKGELRTRDHKAKFHEVAKENGADPAALEALWKLSEYSPDGDEVNVETIKEVIGKTLEANPFMKSSDRDQRPAVVIPAGGQGQRVSNPAGSFTQSYDQGRDPVFQRENRQAIQQAAKAGLLTTLPRE